MSLLRVRGLTLDLPDRAHKPWFGPAPLRRILHSIDLTLEAGEAVGIVGESGSGKTSLGRTLVRLYEPSAGSIEFNRRDITHLPESELRALRAEMQMAFQDTQSALNPRHRIQTILAQPLVAFGRVATSRDALRAAHALLERVGLPIEHGRRYPHELSGGQRQRLGLARAIALRPRLLVADEIVSGLDVSTQAQILDLLRELRSELGLALVLVSHDLSVVRVLCDRVAVLYHGAMVDSGPCAELFARPRHAYTRELLAAIPLPDVDPDWVQRGDSQTTFEGKGMRVAASVALVTGANRGMGRAFVEGLLSGGATKVYAGAREPAKLADLVAAYPGRVEALRLDVTSDAEVAAAARHCTDVSLVISNAGVNLGSAFMAASDMQAARDEMEVNYFGPWRLCQAFAPVLKRNGGGAIVVTSSIAARVTIPLMGSYCASKAATSRLIQGVRAELAGQGTLVVGVMPGAVDTDMAKNFPPPKLAPGDMVSTTLAAVESGTEDVYPGEMAQGMEQGLRADPKGLEKQLAAYLPS